MHYQFKLLFLAAFKIHHYIVQVTSNVTTDNLYILNKMSFMCFSVASSLNIIFYKISNVHSEKNTELFRSLLWI